jgi:hypothetical protein
MRAEPNVFELCRDATNIRRKQIGLRVAVSKGDLSAISAISAGLKKKHTICETLKLSV